MPGDDANPCGGPMGFITIIVLFFLMMILFDPTLGAAVVTGMGWLMHPITFGDKFPVWTIFCSGIILVIITSLIRHKFTDWYDIAKTQKIQSEFNKELRDATLSGNAIKQKKLQEMQPQILKLANKMMFTNMKTMIFTMLFAILIWRWLYSYLDDAPISTMSLPWEYSWPMTSAWSGCPIPFPYWIALYFVISVPIGQVLIGVLKIIEFSKDAKIAEKEQETSLEDSLDRLEAKISSARRDGVMTDRVETLKIKLEAALEDHEYEQAENYLNEAESLIEQNIATRKRTTESINNIKTMLSSAGVKGVNVSAIEPILANAEAALARHDYTKAIYYTKQCQLKLRTAKEKHSEAEDALREIQGIVAESPDSFGKLMTTRLQEVEGAMSSRKYEDVMDSVKKVKGEIDSTRKTYDLAMAQLELAKSLMESLEKLQIETTKIEDNLRNAEDKFNLAQYDECLEIAKDVSDELSKLKKLYEDASESVSFAKLVVANARNFGADVSKAETLLNDAELALEGHDYSKALSKATSAKTIAEEAKRQIQREEKRSRR